MDAFYASVEQRAIRMPGLTVSKSGALSLSNPLRLELGFDEWAAIP